VCVWEDIGRIGKHVAVLYGGIVGGGGKVKVWACIASYRGAVIQCDSIQASCIGLVIGGIPYRCTLQWGKVR
jgi:hypothetical protein